LALGAVAIVVGVITLIVVYILKAIIHAIAIRL